MPGIQGIETIVVLMLENRSFDNVLGHLRHPSYGNRSEVDGLVDPNDTTAYDNFYNRRRYKPFGTADEELRTDLPHERDTIAEQLDVKNGRPTMRGFVRSYVNATGNVVQKPPPMGFITPKWLPVTGFLAEHYLVCNRWFSPLPTGTQPNRAMAFTGCSLIDDNVKGFIPCRDLVFDWLERKNVRWRVYHHGFPFFMLFSGSLDHVLSDRFRSIRYLAPDMQSEPLDQTPQVIFIEPEYADSPVHFGFTPNDNHPPLAMGPGEVLLREVYEALTRNPEKWKRTMLIVTYDEHGGYFDHVKPPAIRTDPPQGAQYKGGAFEHLGVRVPTLIVSPWVAPRSVHDGLFDHTSILQLLAEQFGGGADDYSSEVTARRAKGIRSASEVIDLSAPRTDVPQAPLGVIRTTSYVASGAHGPVNDDQSAFVAAARSVRAHDQRRALDKYPELAHLPD